MNRAVQICEVFEIVEGQNDALLGHPVEFLHIVIWRGAFDAVRFAYAWGEDQCRILAKNYPERRYSHRSFWVAYPYG